MTLTLMLAFPLPWELHAQQIRGVSMPAVSARDEAAIRLLLRRFAGDSLLRARPRTLMEVDTLIRANRTWLPEPGLDTVTRYALPAARLAEWSDDRVLFIPVRGDSSQTSHGVSRIYLFDVDAEQCQHWAGAQARCFLVAQFVFVPPWGERQYSDWAGKAWYAVALRERSEGWAVHRATFHEP